MDTSRNGVTDKCIRTNGSNWCNVNGAGFGVQPTSETNDDLTDAFVWVKPGGESDGTSDPSSPTYDPTYGQSDGKSTKQSFILHTNTTNHSLYSLQAIPNSRSVEPGSICTARGECCFGPLYNRWMMLC